MPIYLSKLTDLPTEYSVQLNLDNKLRSSTRWFRGVDDR